MHPDIADSDAFVVDLDGVIHRGGVPIPRSVEAVHELRRANKQILLVTNNSSRTPGDVAARLHRMGIAAHEDDVLTSAEVAVELIIDQGFTASTVMLVGGDGIRQALEHAGFTILQGSEAANAEIVVVGGDPTFDYDKMRIAADAVRAGALFIATNDDPTFPTPTGLVPGAGAVIAGINVAAGARPTVAGKPHLPMMRAAARRLHGASSIAAVGDQPATDLAGARAMGWKTILVLSGVTTRDAAQELIPAPDVVVADLAELVLGPA